MTTFQKQLDDCTSTLIVSLTAHFEITECDNRPKMSYSHTQISVVMTAAQIMYLILGLKANRRVSSLFHALFVSKRVPRIVPELYHSLAGSNSPNDLTYSHLANLSASDFWQKWSTDCCIEISSCTAASLLCSMSSNWLGVSFLKQGASLSNVLRRNNLVYIEQAKHASGLSLKPSCHSLTIQRIRRCGGCYWITSFWFRLLFLSNKV